MVKGVAAALVTLTLCGCIGATDRADFDDEVRDRGGGLTNVFVTDALDVIAARTGSDSWRDLDVLYLSVDPGSRSVTTAVRDSRRPDFVDTMTVVDGVIASSTPMRDADQLPLDDLVIDVGTIALDRTEDIAARALDEFDDPTGYVDGLTVERELDAVHIDIDLVSDRQTATATFAADGTFTGLRR